MERITFLQRAAWWDCCVIGGIVTDTLKGMAVWMLGEAVDASAAEPVAGALEGEDVGVMHDPVDHCGGDGSVAEDAA